MKKPLAVLLVSRYPVCSLILSWIFLVAFGASVTNAQEPVSSVFSDSLKTVAGELRIVALKDCAGAQKLFRVLWCNLV
jgi:hypothetical protein